jgi:hypothetical protein
MTRPTVNLDGVAAIFDRVLEHPLAQVAAELLPITHGTVRLVRENLPAVASGLEARGIGAMRQEARALEAEIVAGVSRWVQDTIRAGRGEAPVRRLGPKKAARRAKGKKKR